MSSSQRVRPRIAVQAQLQPGRFDTNELERLSSDKVKELTDGASALADFVVFAFVEQRRQRKTAVSEQPMPLDEVAAPFWAIA